MHLQLDFLSTDTKEKAWNSRVRRIQIDLVFAAQRNRSVWDSTHTGRCGNDTSRQWWRQAELSSAGDDNTQVWIVTQGNRSIRHDTTTRPEMGPQHDPGWAHNTTRDRPTTRPGIEPPRSQRSVWRVVVIASYLFARWSNWGKYIQIISHCLTVTNFLSYLYKRFDSITWRHFRLLF